MTSTTPRIAPLPVAEWPQEAHDAYAVMDSSATQEIGKSANLVRVLANHPRLAAAYYTFGRHLLLDSSISHRIREILTLRIAWRCKCQYEWHHHVNMSKRIGLTDAEIEAIRLGPDAEVWSGLERSVLRLTDQLCEHSQVDDATWNELSQSFDRKELMDLVFTIGHYVMVAWALAAFGVEVEPGFSSLEHPLE